MEQLIHLDGQILLWIQDNIRQEWLTPIIKFITYMGNVGIVWIALTVLFLCVAKYRRVGCLSAITLICSFLINNLLLKNIIARTRPYEVIENLELLIGKQLDYSFPSGHAAASFAAGIIFFIYLPKKFGIPALGLAFLISLSRLYVGVHYPSDVLTGGLISTTIAICVWQVDEHLQKKKEMKVVEEA